MLAKRIIPCLDIKEGRVVKGTSFVGLRDAGDPVELAARYNQQSADELIFLDITASKENRGTTIDLASRLARELFIPFTIGGGISSLGVLRSDMGSCVTHPTAMLREDRQKKLLACPKHYRKPWI